MDLSRFIKNERIVYWSLALIVLLGVMGFIFGKAMHPMMVPLYSDLSVEDSNAIISKLQGMNVQYESSQDGRQIMVPHQQVFNLRMAFAQEGIPHSGNIVGYEIFDKSEPLGSSQFVNNINLVRALEGELARTISSINRIENARVHLVMPKKELFNKINNEPSASVVLKARGKHTLDRNEVSAISYLVAHAVPGLKVENITIVDNSGRPLKIGNRVEQGSSIGVVSNAADYQTSVEEKLKNEIAGLLEHSVGVGKVKVNVAAEIDFDREVVNTETFDPDGQVLRSHTLTEGVEKEDDREALANHEPSVKDVKNLGYKDKEHTSETSNYEISRTVSNKVIEGGRLKRLSIAVVVDGIYEINPVSGLSTYKDRSAEELEKLRNLVISAVGANQARGDRVEVTSLKFAIEAQGAPIKDDMMAILHNDIQSILQTLIIGVILVLVMLLIIKPVIMRMFDLIRERQAHERYLQESAVMAASSIGKPLNQEIAPEYAKSNSTEGNAPNNELKRSEAVKRINELVEQNPEDIVSTIRHWLDTSD